MLGATLLHEMIYPSSQYLKQQQQLLLLLLLRENLMCTSCRLLHLNDCVEVLVYH